MQLEVKRRTGPIIAALSVSLLLLNIAVCAKLFRTDYLQQTGTVEGLFVSYARYVRLHWPDIDWCRFWFAGMPLQNAYPPAFHFTVALISYFTHLSDARALHILTAAMYSLGPVTLFWMALRLSGSPGWSFCAGLMYSLVSPSAFLVRDIARDTGNMLWARRLQTPVVYGDSPHGPGAKLSEHGCRSAGSLCSPTPWRFAG